MSQQPPSLIYGTGTLASSFPDPPAVSSLLDSLHSIGITHLDTARRYPATNPGLSERLLGEAQAAKKGFTIDTKILVAGSGSSGAAGSLSREKIIESVNASLKSLGVEKINTLYCHSPDPSTPLPETASTLHTLHEKGLFNQLGLSNYPPSLISAWHALATENDYIRPTVYQGQYSALCRSPETDLISTLRRYGMRFVAFSPLAAGFLSGGSMTSWIAKSYDTSEVNAAVEALREVVEPRGITVPEACLRWLVWHSGLKEGDSVILGGSRFAQVEGNVSGIGRGKLEEEEVVRAVERLADAVVVQEK